MVYRPRIPVAPEYAQHLGQAVYNFAYLEWGVIWSIEKLQPGYLKEYGDGRIVSRRVAALYERLAATAELPWEVSKRLAAAAARFSHAVELRNPLIHGHPFTAKDGEQRMGRKHDADGWTIGEIDDAALEFENCAIEVNELFHGHLKEL